MQQDLRHATCHCLEFELQQQRHQNVVSKTETCIPAEQALTPWFSCHVLEQKIIA